jgi:hypothetical protein
MSNFPKLNIDIRDLTKAPTKLKFIIEEKKPDPEPPPKRINKLIIIPIFILLLIYFVPTSKTHSLRKIIRMTCSISNGIQICSAQGHGEYIVNTENCPSFEFNGIPFTDLTKKNKNYIIPTSPDMTLRIIEPCPTILATIDTQKTISYATTYAKKGNLYMKRVVWITDPCYYEFTLKINDEIIFDRTPIEMIETKHIQNKSAYIYESYGVTGSIFISGNGCNNPIHVYTI